MPEKKVFTDDQVKKHIDDITKLIKDAKGQDQQVIPPKVLKLKGTTVPFISALTNDSYVHPGEEYVYNVTVTNPSSSVISDLYVMCWVGTGFADPGMVSFMDGADLHFARVIMPDEKTYYSPVSKATGDASLTLQPGESKQMYRKLYVPLGTEPTKYPLNFCLLSFVGFHGASPVFDRAATLMYVKKAKAKS